LFIFGNTLKSHEKDLYNSERCIGGARIDMDVLLAVGYHIVVADPAAYIYGNSGYGSDKAVDQAKLSFVRQAALCV
jgi:hypothetical protein